MNTVSLNLEASQDERTPRLPMRSGRVVGMVVGDAIRSRGVLLPSTLNSARLAAASAVNDEAATNLYLGWTSERPQSLTAVSLFYVSFLPARFWTGMSRAIREGIQYSLDDRS